MTDLDELRRVLAEREALAPDTRGIADAARAEGTRIRRARATSVVGGSMVAILAVLALGAALLDRPAPNLPGATAPGSSGYYPPPFSGPASYGAQAPTGGWPATPSYTGPAVPGQPTVPGPTGGPGSPVSGRAIDPVVPYRVTLPD